MVKTLYNSRLVEPLRELAQKEPEFVTLYGNKKLTAKQLFENSKVIALNLKLSGFKEGDTAVMAVEPSCEFIEIIYALLLLQGKIAIIDPEMGRENYAAKILQLNPKWMFADSRLLFLDENSPLKWLALKIRKKLPDIDFKKPIRIVSVGKKMPLRKNRIKFNTLLKKPQGEIQLDFITQSYNNFIVYTSGTLSIPKGVLHSDVSLSETISLLSKILEIEKNDVVGTHLPHFMLLGIASGLSVKILNFNLGSAKKIAWITHEKITVFFGPPSELLPLIIYCEKNNCKLPIVLRHILIGSAPVHQGFLLRLVNVLHEKTKITCTYGMTEHLLVAIVDGREKINYVGEGDLLGKIIDGVQLRICADGEIEVQSKQLYTKYFHETENVEWHSTGDLGKLDLNGNLILLGRKKEMIIRKDFNIYPALYEGTIKKIEGINEVAFVGIYDDSIHDEVVYLVVETNLDNINHLRKLLEHGKYGIDRQAMPDFIIKMKIPRKGRQDKIDRNAIINQIKGKAK